MITPVVQWIEYRIPVPIIGVRIPTGVQDKNICFNEKWFMKNNCLLTEIDDNLKINQYLLGLLTCNMDGSVFTGVHEPYIVINAIDEMDAEDIYRTKVPLSSYYPPYVVAEKRMAGKWTLKTTDINQQQMNEMLMKEVNEVFIE